MTELVKYKEGEFVLPCVVDFINFESHIVLDVIQLKGELFKPGDALRYKEDDLSVTKMVKDYPIQTDAKIENRLEVRKVRYFCNKLKQDNHEAA